MPKKVGKTVATKIKCGPRRRVSMDDVAARAGVTRSAVSVALSGRKSTVSISDATREKILQAAKELDYKPNIFGRNLSDRRSYSLALLCRECFFPQILDVVKGIQDVAYDRGYSLLMYYHGDLAVNEREHISRSKEKHVDGLLVMPALDPDGKTNVDVFRKLFNDGVPVVQVLGSPLPGIPSAQSEQYGTEHTACRYLQSLGHQRIAYVTHAGAYDEKIKGFYGTIIERMHGYRDAMQETGLEPLVFAHPVPENTGSPKEYFQYGLEYAERIASHPTKPTAVMVYNGYVAVGLLNGFKNLGVKVPQDISVLGSNTVEMESMLVFDPPMTAMVESTADIGQRAAEMVFEMLEGKAVANSVLEQKLIVRESTAPPSPR